MPVAEYKEHVNPGIANSFATAAMRFGHSQLEGLMKLRDVNFGVSKMLPLSTVLRIVASFIISTLQDSVFFSK